MGFARRKKAKKSDLDGAVVEALGAEIRERIARERAARVSGAGAGSSPACCLPFLTSPASPTVPKPTETTPPRFIERRLGGGLEMYRQGLRRLNVSEEEGAQGKPEAPPAPEIA